MVIFPLEILKNMQQELSKYLAELLHHHERLSVPGLGTFELEHAPALIDQVQGQVSAPAKHIRFNDNLVMDDGVLVDFIQGKLGWSLTQTKRWVESQVAEVKATLDRREIVELAGVGRFFRNFENQLQFVAENSNFNLDSFGLQPVGGQIVPRAQTEKIPAIQKKAPPPPPPNPASVPGDDLLDWLKTNLNWLLAILLLLVLVAVFLFYPRSPEASVYDEEIAELPQERLNASPSKTPEDETAPPPTTDAGEDENSTEPATTPEENLREEERPVEVPPSAPDTEAPTLSPEEHSAVIAVGLFGDPDNVQRLLERLSKSGYAPISRPEGENTRVGVSVRFTEERELRSVLREIKDKYTSSAYIMMRDGQEVREK